MGRSSLRSGMLTFGLALLVGCGGQGELPTPVEVTPAKVLPAAGSAVLTIESTRRATELGGRRSAAGAFALVQLTLGNRGVEAPLSLSPSVFSLRMRDRTLRHAAGDDLSQFGAACSASVLVESGGTSTCFLAFEIPKGDWPLELHYDAVNASAITVLGAAPTLEDSGLSCAQVSECRAACDTHACEERCLDRASGDGKAAWRALDQCLMKSCRVMKIPAPSEQEPCGYDAAGQTYTPLECDVCRAAAETDGGDCVVEHKVCTN